MDIEKIKEIGSIIFYITLIASLLGLISQYIWNTVISDIFSLRQISFLESILINLLFRIYFQSFSNDDK
jgi:hypothetical protein